MADANQPLGGTAIKPVCGFHILYIDHLSYLFIHIFYIWSHLYHICNTMPQVGWDRTGWEAFKYMLFDPDNGTILTRCDLKYKGKSKFTSKLKFTNLFCRTPLSWLKITVFYIIYYTLLACFWIACLVIFFQVSISYWLLPLSNILYLPSQ